MQLRTMCRRRVIGGVVMSMSPGRRGALVTLRSPARWSAPSPGPVVPVSLFVYSTMTGLALMSFRCRRIRGRRLLRPGIRAPPAITVLHPVATIPAWMLRCWAGAVFRASGGGIARAMGRPWRISSADRIG